MTYELDADVHPHAHVKIDDDGEWLSVPLEEQRRGRLLFTSGIAPYVSIRGERSPDAFISTRFTRPIPDIHVADETVTIRYRAFRLGFGARGVSPGSIALNTTIPWTIDVRGGMANMDIDLRDLHVESFDVNGGISRVVVTLPKPAGFLPIRIMGGVSELVVRRPAGVAARVIVRGGAAGLTLDDSYFGAVGGELRWEGQGDADSASRVDLTITGGASRVTLERYTPVELPADNTSRNRS